MAHQELERKISIGSLLQFAFPSIIMMIVMSLYTIIDGIFVSRLVGTAALSAVNIAYPLLSFVIALGTMFGTGVSAVVSIKMGEGRYKEARENISFITLVAVLTGCVIAVVSFLFLEDFIYLMGADDSIYQLCYDYLFPLLFFQPANILQLEFQSLFVANGKPYIGLGVTVAGGVANMVLDYVFIYTFDMGIAGAAIATGIGCSIPALYALVYFLFNRKVNLYFVRPKADWRVLFKTMTNGSSEMVTNLSACITTFLFNIILMRIVGQDGVAAISILLYIDFMLISVSYGYSMGIAPLISYNYGKKDIEKLHKLYRISLWFCVGVGIFMTSGTLLSSKGLALVFADRGSAVYNLTVSGLKIYAFGYLFKGFNIFTSAMFTAYGDGRISATLSFLRTLVFLVVLLLALPLFMGVEGVWFAPVLAEILAIVLALYFTVRKKTVYYYLP